MFSSLVQAVPHIKTGRLRALGTGGKERVPALADVPTISEAGVPGYEALNWWGLLAPAGTPQPVIERLHKALEEAQDAPEIQAQFEKEGAATRKTSSADFGKFIESEMNKWSAWSGVGSRRVTSELSPGRPLMQLEIRNNRDVWAARC
jgi:tripartite-type tricarboxylate transporter receptor subunit TctC